jgi:hypothetical protein
MATTATGEDMRNEFILATVDLDGVSVERQDGRIVATRDLTDDEISLGDVIDLARKYDLAVGDAQMDVPAGEARLVVGGDA